MHRPILLFGVCLSVAACFAPRYPEGSRCTNECPGDLSCVGGFCTSGDGDGDDAGGEPDAGADAPAACPSDYVLNASTGSYYRVVTTAVPQATAVTNCDDDAPGAYLAIPDDDNENRVLDSLATNDTWLGVSDMGMDGVWRTVLGGVPTHLPWAPGQPDGGLNEACAYLADRAWQDTSCTATTKPYICECR